ncbi:MAG: hypothetical protein KAS32_14955 [Candidatus Peribacteraceae bacterium]|nr:hypothetical protein [Candidatus Peribacteraceae bacterium]
MRKVFILLMFMCLSLSAQKAIERDAASLFVTADSLTIDANGISYLQMTNADTFTSRLEVLSDGRSGSTRITVLIDTTSGTTKRFLECGLKVGSFGTDAKDYIYNMVDSLVAADAGVAQTYELPDYSWWDSPVAGYVWRLRGVGTQNNQVYVTQTCYYPNK